MIYSSTSNPSSLNNQSLDKVKLIKHHMTTMMLNYISIIHYYITHTYNYTHTHTYTKKQRAKKRED